MKLKIIIPIIVTAILIASLIIIFLNPLLTGKVVENNKENENYFKSYSHTKAICNKSNFCQDYEIICNGKEVISLKPITGAVIQQPENWKDPRNKTNLCE